MPLLILVKLTSELKSVFVFSDLQRGILAPPEDFVTVMVVKTQDILRRISNAVLKCAGGDLFAKTLGERM